MKNKKYGRSVVILSIFFAYAAYAMENDPSIDPISGLKQIISEYKAMNIREMIDFIETLKQYVSDNDIIKLKKDFIALIQPAYLAGFLSESNSPMDILLDEQLESIKKNPNTDFINFIDSKAEECLLNGEKNLLLNYVNTMAVNNSNKDEKRSIALIIINASNVADLKKILPRIEILKEKATQLVSDPTLISTLTTESTSTQSINKINASFFSIEELKKAFLTLFPNDKNFLDQLLNMTLSERNTRDYINTLEFNNNANQEKILLKNFLTFYLNKMFPHPWRWLARNIKPNSEYPAGISEQVIANTFAKVKEEWPEKFKDIETITKNNINSVFNIYSSEMGDNDFDYLEDFMEYLVMTGYVVHHQSIKNELLAIHSNLFTHPDFFSLWTFPKEEFLKNDEAINTFYECIDLNDHKNSITPEQRAQIEALIPRAPQPQEISTPIISSPASTDENTTVTQPAVAPFIPKTAAGVEQLLRAEFKFIFKRSAYIILQAASKKSIKISESVEPSFQEYLTEYLLPAIQNDNSELKKYCNEWIKNQALEEPLRSQFFSGNLTIPTGITIDPINNFAPSLTRSQSPIISRKATINTISHPASPVVSTQPQNEPTPISSPTHHIEAPGNNVPADAIPGQSMDDIIKAYNNSKNASVPGNNVSADITSLDQLETTFKTVFNSPHRSSNLDALLEGNLNLAAARLYLKSIEGIINDNDAKKQNAELLKTFFEFYISSIEKNPKRVVPVELINPVATKSSIPNTPAVKNAPENPRTDNSTKKSTTPSPEIPTSNREADNIPATPEIPSAPQPSSPTPSPAPQSTPGQELIHVPQQTPDDPNPSATAPTPWSMPRIALGAGIITPVVALAGFGLYKAATYCSIDTIKSNYTALNNVMGKAKKHTLTLTDYTAAIKKLTLINKATHATIKEYITHNKYDELTAVLKSEARRLQLLSKRNLCARIVYTMQNSWNNLMAKVKGLSHKKPTAVIK